MSHNELLNVRQTAALFHVHENTIRNWAKSGVLPCLRLPGSGYRRFDPAVITRLLQEMRTDVSR